MVGEARQRTPAVAGDLDRIEASIHDWLGRVFLDRGRKGEARAHFDASLKLRQGGVADELPEQPERQSDLAASFTTLGKFFSDQEKWKEALDYYERALVIRRKLCEGDKRYDWLRNLAQSLANVSRVQFEIAAKTKDPAMNRRVVELAKERLTIVQRLRAEDPSDSYQIDYADALAGYADLLLNTSDPALKNWPRALELAQEAVQQTERRNARSLSVLAQALRFTKQFGPARQTAEEALALLPPANQRTGDERQVWYNINWELQKNPKGSGKTTLAR